MIGVTSDPPIFNRTAPDRKTTEPQPLPYNELSFMPTSLDSIVAAARQRVFERRRTTDLSVLERAAAKVWAPIQCARKVLATYRIDQFIGLINDFRGRSRTLCTADSAFRKIS